MWNGAFSPVSTVSTVVVENAEQEEEISKNPDLPTKVEYPLDPLPDIEDLEVWYGVGSVRRAWEYDGITYLTVNFDHSDVCFMGENVPSNYVNYVYLYYEADLENLVEAEFGSL